MERLSDAGSIPAWSIAKKSDYGQAFFVYEMKPTMNGGDYYSFFVLIYPILVSSPAGFLLISEIQRKEDALLMTRIGIKRYYLSFMAAPIIMTALIFMLPLFNELILRLIAFPANTTGDVSLFSIFSKIQKCDWHPGNERCDSAYRNRSGGFKKIFSWQVIIRRILKNYPMQYIAWKTDESSASGSSDIGCV